MPPPCSQRLSICAVALALWAPAVGQAEPSSAVGPGYRIHSETLLILDRWRGTRTVDVERTDLRQRLRLDAWALAPDAPGRLDLRIDLELGTDLGPTARALEQVPDSRRAILDLYSAHLAWHDLVPGIDVRLGRHRVFDALGLDALDGATVDVRLVPHVTVRALGGLAVRRAWSTFGPDLYAPDGTALRDEAGAVYGLGVRTRDLDALRLDVTWRRHQDAEAIVRDEVGAAGLVMLTDGLDLSTGAVIDLVWQVPSALWLGLGWLPMADLRLDAEWRRTQPTFAADSIWFIFGPEPADAGRVVANWSPGVWRVTVDSELRVFDPGPDDGEAPAGDDTAVVTGARVERRIPIGVRSARVGVDSRLSTGHGGDLQHADLFGRVPIRLRAPEEPLWLELRAGAAHFDAPDRDLWDGWAGWLAGSGQWYAAEGIRLDGVIEGHMRPDTSPRIRAMARLTVEDHW